MLGLHHDGVTLDLGDDGRRGDAGDARVACIAAASIVAKVERDAIMVQAEQRYPGYGFAASKGYASPEHIESIRRRGITDYHRASFCTHFLPSGGEAALGGLFEQAEE